MALASLLLVRVRHLEENATRVGCLATHHSGEPFPEPMRVSAGFFVIAWSGKDRDPDLSTTTDVAGSSRYGRPRSGGWWTYAGSSAWMPYSPKTTRVPPFRRTRTPRVVRLCGSPSEAYGGISMTQPSCASFVAPNAVSVGRRGLGRRRRGPRRPVAYSTGAGGPPRGAAAWRTRPTDGRGPASVPTGGRSGRAGTDAAGDGQGGPPRSRRGRPGSSPPAAVRHPRAASPL